MFTSAVESFERIVSLYAQQLSLNETQCFVTPSLTLITELVSTNLTSHHWTKIYVMLTKIRAFLHNVIYLAEDRAEFKINEICRKFCSILHIFLYTCMKFIFLSSACTIKRLIASYRHNLCFLIDLQKSIDTLAREGRGYFIGTMIIYRKSTNLCCIKVMRFSVILIKLKINVIKIMRISTLRYFPEQLFFS